MRVLITGCSGQVGQCLTTQIEQIKNVDVLALGRQQLDISDKDAVNDKVRKFKPNIIINAAAYTEVDKAEEQKHLAYAVNYYGAKYLAQAAHDVDAAILHISTDYVFEGSKDGEYVETDDTNPQSVYGESKLAGELAVTQECEKHIILRTAWVFGINGNNFVRTMLRLGASRDVLSIVGDQFGGPTYAGDIATALIHIAEEIMSDNIVEYGIYHFSGLPHVSWYEFAHVIFDTAKKNNILENSPKLTSITTEQYPTAAKRPCNSRLNSGRINRAFSIEASDWQMALQNINYCKG